MRRRHEFRDGLSRGIAGKFEQKSGKGSILQETALRIFKTYLKHCGAAFVNDEMTENIEEMFVVELENKNV